MNDEPEILKIEIPLEEDEVPAKAEGDNGRRLNLNVKEGMKRGVNKVGQGVNRAGQAAWHSDTRKSVTGGMKRGVQKGVTAVASKSAELMHEHMIKAAENQARQQAANMETKIRETDWQAEASKGAAAGLHLASDLVGRLAARLTGPEKPPDQQPPDEN